MRWKLSLLQDPFELKQPIESDFDRAVKKMIEGK